MKLSINHLSGKLIYEAEATTILELLYLAIKDSANLEGANLSRACLVGANLGGSYLVGADLEGASLEFANLVGAYLVGANLEGANLSRANLAGVDLEGANLVSADLVGANLVSANLVSANLVGADLEFANLEGANLSRAKLSRATIIETGETWEVYLAQVLPALLTAGGRTLAEVLTAKHWDCHSWDNCPLAAAFEAKGFEGVPILLKPRAEQFIRYFDAKLIPLDAVGKVAV